VDPKQFFGGVHAGDLGLGDGLATGFRVLTKPAYIVVVLIASVIISLTIEQAIGSLLRDRLALGTDILEERLPLLLSSAIVSVVGGMLVSTYGQVWLVLATSTGEPTVRAALARTLDRWLALVGAGLVIGLLGIAVSVPLLLVVGRAAVVLLVPFLVYFGSRLSLATWFAADGHGTVAAIRESWAVTRGRVVQIVAWNIVLGLVIGVMNALVGAVLGEFPLGVAIVQGFAVAIEFGVGVALYRNIQARAELGDPTRDARGYLV
jgi:hypothetical protein